MCVLRGAVGGTRLIFDASNIVAYDLWSALLLLGSSCLELTPCFCLSFYLTEVLSQLCYIFLENLSLFENLFFSPVALIYNSVCVWYVCVCVFVCVCVCVCVCVLDALTSENLYI